MHDHGDYSVGVELEEFRLMGIARLDVELHALAGDAELGENSFGEARGGNGYPKSQSKNTSGIIRLRAGTFL